MMKQQNAFFEHDVIAQKRVEIYVNSLLSGINNIRDQAYADLENYYQPEVIVKVLGALDGRKKNLNAQGEAYRDRLNKVYYRINDSHLLEAAQFCAKRGESISSLENELPNNVIAKMESESYIQMHKLSYSDPALYKLMRDRVNNLISIIKITTVIERLEHLLLSQASSQRPVRVGK